MRATDPLAADEALVVIASRRDIVAASAQLDALALLDRMLAAHADNDRWGPGLRYALGISGGVQFALRAGDSLETIAARARFELPVGEVAL